MVWTPPLVGFVKLNLDGASKGNPRSVGYGGVFKDTTGEIIHTYASSLVQDTNNAIEL